MHRLYIDDRMIQLDEDGFLVDSGEWTETVAAALARVHGLDPVTDDHWAVIRCIRGYYEAYDAPPMVRLVTRRTGLDAGRLAELFQTTFRDCMCRLAGLPRPTG